MKTRLVHVRVNVHDLEKAVQWYCNVLGFELDSLWPSEKPVYADFHSQEGAVFSIGVTQTIPCGGRFNFAIQDVDAFWESLRDKVEIVEPLFDTPYGTRKFTIRDPDGNELGFTKTLTKPNPNDPVLELRIAFTTSDYKRLVKFYCAGLGIEPAAIWNNDQGQALVLDMGKATLEIFDEAQAEIIDQLEAGRRTSGQIRFAIQVPDLQAAMQRLLAHGAKLVHSPVMTPWGDYNVRLEDPDGMQITLFQAQS